MVAHHLRVVEVGRLAPMALMFVTVLVATLTLNPPHVSPVTGSAHCVLTDPFWSDALGMTVITWVGWSYAVPGMIWNCCSVPTVFHITARYQSYPAWLSAAADLYTLVR